ncbi:MAG: DUF882 domain-containing protein [Devosia sp.]|nr:DUF882 domain-containing protein [Devosia sp.]
MDWQRLVRLVFAALMAIAVLLPPTTLPVGAETGERTLYLYHTHTHETARITFKRNGVYDPKGLQQLDWFLRDFRTNEPTEMAPQLFDLVWEVYQKTGATQPINIVSAYRSPATNAYLRAHSNGVASHSQHMLGHAMDIFIPGVPLTTLRAVAMQQQVGGVGFYPTSSSPFVHMDVGTVRAWPRMTTAQLQAIFPDGRTLHVPADGRVLSSSGYAQAEAQWNQCHAVPCSNPAAVRGGATALGRQTMVAATQMSGTGKTFNDIFRGVDPGNANVAKPGNAQLALAGMQQNAGSSDDDETADASVTAGPAQTAVTTVAIIAPVPLDRPATLDEGLQVASIAPLPTPLDDASAAVMTAAAAVPFDKLFPAAYSPGTLPAAAAAVAAAAANSPAPVPARKSHDLMLATGEVSARGRPLSALGAIASIEAPVPAMRSDQRDSAVSAYAPTGGSQAERQLQAIIENETTGALMSSHGTGLTNSVGSPIGADALKSYAAGRRSNADTAVAIASLTPLPSFAARSPQLVAPGFAATLVQPVAFTSDDFAVFVEPSATDLSPATELGPMVVRVGFHPQTPAALSVTRFGPPANPLLVASR